jgi:hypothetical protein
MHRMKDAPLKARHTAVRAVRLELSEADDQKVKRVIAMLDDLADPSMNQAMLDPLRARVASLNIVRPLRFPRLLFMPLDPLIMAARHWRPGDPSIPRTALAPIARSVRAGLGGEAVFIEKTIAGRKTDATLAISNAGEALWPRAAEILAEAAAPADWEESGLPAKAYAPMARAISAVFRRAPQLRTLQRDGELGVVQTSESAVADILQDIAKESEEGRAMIARLILLQSPHAAPMLRRLIASSQDMASKIMVRQAIDRSTEQMLSVMEQEAGFTEEIGHLALANVGTQVRRITTFLREIEEDTGSSIDRPRLHAIRQKLDAACRERFSDGLSVGVLTPLSAASGPVDGPSQSQMETCSRELRELEVEARKVGGAANYDRMLHEASAAVLEAAAAGTLTTVRKLRLIEILAGPEVAAELYEQG